MRGPEPPIALLRAIQRRLRRETQGLPLRAQARATGISAATLSRLYCDKEPDFRTFAALCRWFGVDLVSAIDA
jgi:transcriptional regulator with XRE-family HTH domain